MNVPKQQMLWDGYSNGFELGHTNYTFSEQTNPQYCTAEPADDRDLFFTGGSYYAVRVEQETNLHPTVNQPYSEIDNTAVPIGDGNFDDEETVNVMGDYGATDERVMQLQMEIERLRSDYERLLLEVQSNDQDGNTEVEEVIEEEVRTIRPNRPSAKQVESVPVESVRPTTREVAIQSPIVTYRTTSTMATPTNNVSKQCFGVNVRPLTRDAGALCSQPMKREFGCTAGESDAMLADWVERYLSSHSENTRKIITKLLLTSSKNRESFVESILDLLKKDGKSVGTEVKPPVRQQFTMTSPSMFESPVVEIPKVGAPPPPTILTESQMIEARPIMENKYVMTSRVNGIHVGVATESILLRSQGSQSFQQPLELTTSSAQTDKAVGFVDRGVHPVAENIQNVGASAQTTVSLPPTSIDAPTTVRTTIESRTSTTTVDNNLLSEVIKKAMEQSSESTRTTHLRANRPLTPTEVQRYFPSGIGSPSPVPADFTDTGETTSHGPYEKTSQGEACTISTERRIVDEHSACHLLPDDVNIEELVRGDSALRDSLLARSKPISSSHVVRHYQPSIEVVHHVTDEPSEPRLRPLTPIEIPLQVPPNIPNTGSTASPSSKQTSYEIPVFHTSPTEHPESVEVRSYIAHSPDLKHFWSETTRSPGISSSKEVSSKRQESYFSRQQTSYTHPSTNGASSPHPTHKVFGSPTDTSDFAGRTFHRGPRSFPSKIPVRNHSFKATDEIAEACRTLVDEYLAHGGGPIQKSPDLTKLTNLCFDLASTVEAKCEQLEDFFALLYEYHPELLKSVLQSTNEQGDTCLHLAVGHGAWEVVNLILNSGFAEPDKLNRAGYSPIMVASLGAQLTPHAFDPLDRLFAMGDVNLRSSADTHRTPLMLAAQSGALEMVELLIKHGASVNMQDRAGNTALLFAVQQGNHAVVAALLCCPEIDLHLCDNRGDDALAIAMRLHDDRVIQMLKCAMEGRTGTATRSHQSSTKYTIRRNVHEILHDLHSTRFPSVRPKTVSRLS